MAITNLVLNASVDSPAMVLNPSTVRVSIYDSGLPVTSGLSVTVNVTDPDGNFIVSSGSTTNNNDGTYGYTIAATLLANVGSYTVGWSVSAAGYSAYKEIILPVNYETSSSRVRYEIRQQAARLIQGQDGFFTGSLTSATSSTLVPSGRPEQAGMFKGWYVYIYAGTGSGQESRVSEWDGTTLTVSPAFGTIPDSTSKYELHKYASATTINETMSLAVEEVQNEVLIPVITTGTLVATTFEYALPPGFTHVYALQVKMTNGEYFNVVPAAWKIIRGLRSIQINGKITYVWAGCTYRILGMRYVNNPLDDYTEMEVPSPYIINKTAADVCAQLIKSEDTKDWKSRSQMYYAISQSARAKGLNGKIPPNLKRVE